MAAVFSMGDALADIREDGLGPHVAIEGLIAAALLAGVIVGRYRFVACGQRGAGATPRSRSPRGR
ncbi:hypothetical protein ACRAWD_27270 [Caulobacter segnis]